MGSTRRNTRRVHLGESSPLLKNEIEVALQLLHLVVRQPEARKGGDLLDLGAGEFAHAGILPARDRRPEKGEEARLIHDANTESLRIGTLTPRLLPRYQEGGL